LTRAKPGLLLQTDSRLCEDALEETERAFPVEGLTYPAGYQPPASLQFAGACGPVTEGFFADYPNELVVQ
jgi:hypothetical protein